MSTRLTLWACAALTLAACDATGEVGALDVVNDQTSIPYLATVETTVLPASIGTGGTAIVSCAGKDQNGQDFTPELPLTFEVFDANDQAPAGVTIVGDRVTAQYAGVVRVRCYYPGTPRVEDGSPISLAATKLG